MKIYDWKTFLGSVIICVGVIAYKIISFDDIFDSLHHLYHFNFDCQSYSKQN